LIWIILRCSWLIYNAAQFGGKGLSI
jgi:hypothetical protein